MCHNMLHNDIQVNNIIIVNDKSFDNLQARGYISDF